MNLRWSRIIFEYFKLFWVELNNAGPTGKFLDNFSEKSNFQINISHNKTLASYYFSTNVVCYFSQHFVEKLSLENAYCVTFTDIFVVI